MHAYLTDGNMHNTQKHFLSLRQAYLVLYFLLEQALENKKDSEELMNICTDMSLSESENSTLDPAMWDDWLQAIDGQKTKIVLRQSLDCTSWYEAIEGQREEQLHRKQLTIKEAYDAATRFLNNYIEEFDAQDVKALAQELTFNKWIMAVKQVTNEGRQ